MRQVLAIHIKMEWAYTKISGWALRVQHAVQWLPLRLKRLGQHLLRFCFHWRWWTELPFYVLDVIAFPEILECIQDGIFWYQRPLLKSEYDILYSVFGDCLPYQRIRIDLRSHLGPRSHRMYYVQCCTINSWGGIPDDILIHEAVHIWQFMREGSAYIPRALRAQASDAGYNYGGAEFVKKVAQAGGLMQDFNHEQQADLIADYWRIKHYSPARWGQGSKQDLPYYQYFVDQLCESFVR